MRQMYSLIRRCTAIGRLILGRNAQKLLKKCAGNAGVFRPTFLTTIYFLGNAVAVHIVPSLNREAWPAKYVLYMFLVLGFCFVPNDPLFLDVYLNIARIGAIPPRRFVESCGIEFPNDDRSAVPDGR